MNVQKYVSQMSNTNKCLGEWNVKQCHNNDIESQ